MSRDRVYQLRLTSEEKERLFHLAQGRELSIAGMIRKDYGLAERGKGITCFSSDEATPPVATKPLVDNPSVPYEDKARIVTRLARQRYGHLPLGAAEREVRKELGL